MAIAILVVDDNPTFRKLVCKLLETEKRYDICADAANGQQAIDLAIRHRPNLIILDLSMPVMDGLAAARKLKALMPDVPIILFTQHANLGKHLTGSDLLVDRIVSKTEPIELLAHVRSLLPVSRTI